jgi:hypothetical protein
MPLGKSTAVASYESDAIVVEERMQRKPINGMIPAEYVEVWTEGAVASDFCAAWENTRSEAGAVAVIALLEKL